MPSPIDKYNNQNGGNTYNDGAVGVPNKGVAPVRAANAQIAEQQGFNTYLNTHQDSGAPAAPQQEPHFWDTAMNWAGDQLDTVENHTTQPLMGNVAGRLALGIFTVPGAVLAKGMEVANYGENAISRGMSTFVQMGGLTSPFTPVGMVAGAIGAAKGQGLSSMSPLYKDGFQWSDFKDAFNNSEHISPGQAITGAAMNMVSVGSVEPLIGSAPLGTQGVNYLDPTVQEELKKNNIYNLGTGGVDALWQVAASKGVGVVGGIAAKSAGLNTAMAGARDMAKFSNRMQEGVNAVKGVEGARPNPFGNMVMNLSEAVKARDVRSIRENPLVHNSNKADDLVQHLLTQTKGVDGEVGNTDIIQNIILADHGDVSAIARVFQNHPHLAYAMANMNEKLATDFAMRGVRLTSDDQAVLNSVFDSAIAADPVAEDMFRRFLGTDKDGKFTQPLTNNTSVPRGALADNWMGNTLGKLENEGANVRGVVKYGSTLPGEGGGFSAKFLGAPGSSGPMTVLAQYLGGKRAMNMIGFSGARSNDGWEEWSAWHNGIKEMRGNPTMQLVRKDAKGKDVTTSMSKQEWLAGMQKNLVEATDDNARRGIYEAAEHDVIGTIFHNRGFDNPRVRSDVIKSVQDQRNSKTDGIAKDGYGLDERSNRIYSDQVVRSQMADHLPLIDLRALRAHIRENPDTMKATFWAVARGSDEMYQRVAAVFRTSALYKFGYTIKNSIAEPGLSGFLAGGAYLLTDGAGESLKNFATNMGRRGKLTGYWMADKSGLSGLDRSQRSIEGHGGLADQLAKQQKTAKDDTTSRVRGMQQNVRAADITATRNVKNAERVAAGEKRVSYPPLVVSTHQQRILDEHSLEEIQAGLEQSGGKSPGWLGDNLPLLQAEHSTIQSRVFNAYKHLKRIDPEWETQIGVMPTLTRMRERAAELRAQVNNPELHAGKLEESSAMKDLKAGEHSDPQSAQSLYDSADSDFNRAEFLRSDMFDPEKALRSLDKLDGHLDNLSKALDGASMESALPRSAAKLELDSITQRFDAATAKLGQAQMKRSAARERVRRGDKDIVLKVGGGKKLSVAGITAAENQPLVNEISASRNVSMTVNPDYTGSLAGRHRRTGSMRVMDNTDSGYWDEWKWHLNTKMRNDTLPRMIWNDRATDYQLASWLKAPEGIKYKKDMNWDNSAVAQTPSRLIEGPDGKSVTLSRFDETKLEDIKQQVNQLVPNDAVRDILRKKEISPGELRANVPLADQSRIMGSVLETETGSLFQRAADAYNRTMNKGWASLATKPEDNFGRLPFAAMNYKMVMQRNIDSYLSQMPAGHTMTMDDVNAFKDVARAEVIKNVERTFYNIRRYPNVVYAMRYLMNFPGAYLNSIVRITKLGLENPGRAMFAAHAWQSMYDNFGIDANGNKENDPSKVTTWMWDFPKPMADAMNKVGLEQIRVNPATINPVGGNAGLGWAASMAYETSIRINPNIDDAMKNILGQESYDKMFAYGHPNSQYGIGPIAVDALIPAIGKDLLNALNPGSDKNKETTNQLLAYQMTVWEKAGSDPATRPDWQEAQGQAKGFLLLVALAREVLPGGVRLTPNGTIFKEEYQRLLQANGGDPTKAKKDMISQHGSWISAELKSTSKYEFFATPTMSSMNRMKNNPDLVKQAYLAASTPTVQDNSMASILFADEPQGFDQVAYNQMGDMSILQDGHTVRSRMSPEEYDKSLYTDAGWKVYGAAKAKKDAMVLKYGYKSLNDASATWLRDQWNTFLDGFQADPNNSGVTVVLNSPNRAKSLIALQVIDSALADKSFIASSPQPAYWDTIKEYLAARKLVNAAIDRAPNALAKADLKDQIDTWASTTLSARSTGFANTYNRFLDGEWKISIQAKKALGG